jgi:hypothetical protein
VAIRFPKVTVRDALDGFRDIAGIVTSMLRDDEHPVGWDDVRSPANGIKVPTTNPATWSDAEVCWSFSKSAINVVGGQLQMPHRWKEGSTISPHAHCFVPVTAAAPNNTIRLVLRYKFVTIGEAVPAAWTSDPVTVTVDGSLARKHVIFEFSDITEPSKKLSSMFIWELERTGNDAANDKYDDVMYLMEFDIHYQSDNNRGSQYEYQKWAKPPR